MQSWSSRSLFLSLCLGVAVMPAFGQDRHASFEGQITVTATGSEEVVDEVPLAVTVIDREEIEATQEESVAEMLRLVPGLTVMRAGGDGSATSLFTRGTDSDHTLALFDGVRLNSPYFGGYDWSQLPTFGLERIEVARGPFSALWGADAIGGVVNVVPMRGSDGLSASFFGEGGQESWKRFEGAVGWAGNGWDVYAAAFKREGEAHFENSDYDNQQVLLDAGWSWGSGSRVAVLVQDLESDIGVPFTDPVSMTPNRRQRSDQRLIAVPVRVKVNDRWNFELVASQVERDLAFRDPDDPWGFTWADTVADTQQARLASHHRLGSHDLSWGGEWREDEVSDVSSFGTNLAKDTSDVTSAFVQDVWLVHPDVQVIAGVRWDDAEEWGSEVSPRLSVGWNVGGSVQLRASYGESFRQPSVGELYFPFSGNPELEAEQAESVEAGLTWFVGDARIQANVFSTEVDNLIEFDNARFTFGNIAQAEMRGAELAWSAPVSGHLVSMFQTTWLDTENAEGDPLLRRPEWSASWSLHGELLEHLRGALSVVWVGSRDDIDPISFERTELSSHFTAHLSLAYEVIEGLEITLRAYNLADREYEEIAGYPAPGRRITGGLRWKLGH